MFWKNSDKSFESLFMRHIALTVQAATELEALLANPAENAQKVQKIVELEHQADRVVAEGYELLDNTFITKLDKPDIVELLHQLDHVIDCMEDTASRLKIYGVTQAKPGAVAISRIIVKMAETLEKMFKGLSKPDIATMKPLVLEIKKMEEEADEEFAKDLQNLFGSETDAKKFVVWKNILEMLERTTDRCTSVANVLNSIARKEGR